MSRCFYVPDALLPKHRDNCTSFHSIIPFCLSHFAITKSSRSSPNASSRMDARKWCWHCIKPFHYRTRETQAAAPTTLLCHILLAVRLVGIRWHLNYIIFFPVYGIFQQKLFWWWILLIYWPKKKSDIQILKMENEFLLRQFNTNLCIEFRSKVFLNALRVNNHYFRICNDLTTK